MNNAVIITCVLTGAGETTAKSELVPTTPEQIAVATVEAALFKQTVGLIRGSGVDMVLNLMAGMGGDWVPDATDPSMPGEGTDMVDAQQRLAHVFECRPDICSLDCGTLNFGDGTRAMVVDMLRGFERRGGRLMYDDGARYDPGTLTLGGGRMRQSTEN